MQPAIKLRSKDSGELYRPCTRHLGSATSRLRAGVSRAVPISSPQVMVKPIELQDSFVKRDTLSLPTSTDQVTEE